MSNSLNHFTIPAAITTCPIPSLLGGLRSIFTKVRVLANLSKSQRWLGDYGLRFCPGYLLFAHGNEDPILVRQPDGSLAEA